MTNLENIKLGVYEKSIPLQLSWKEKFECAKNAGFDFIELSIDGLEPRINRLEPLRRCCPERHYAGNRCMSPYLPPEVRA